MNPKRPLLTWLLVFLLALNTVANIFFLATLSKIYKVDDFKPDLASRDVQYQITADKIELPPIKIVNFISAYAYKPSQVVFTGQSLIIFVNLSIVSELNEAELKAVIAHEIGHYVSGHLIFNPYTYNKEEENNFKKEVEADAFAAKYEGVEAIRGAILKLAWDPEEKSIRLGALSVN